MNYNVLKFILGGIVTISITSCVQDKSISQNNKEVFLPKKIWMVPDDNDYSKPESKYSLARKEESDNIIMLWDSGFGDNEPLQFADSTKRFDSKAIINEGERFYKCFIDDLKFLDTGNSLTDKYKMLTLVICDDNNVVYGGGAGDTIGVNWMRPSRMLKYPYCAYAHELSHSFQYMIRADGSEISGSPAYGEMTSQWMLSHVYPDWITIENYHWQSLMKKTHYGLFHETNMYHSPYIFEYWGYLHGDTIVGKVWRETRKGEDMIMAYKRITNISQSQFNNEIYDHAARLITYDIPRIEDVAKRYANQHSCKLEAESNGWYKIAKSRCPQNYGYNGIRLNNPMDGTEVTLEFEGIMQNDAYNSINPEFAGWRYGFLAVDTNGKRTYGDICDASKGSVKFTTPENTQYLWIVVTGAPTQHWERPRPGDGSQDEEWPYKIKLSGTTIHEYMIN